MIIKLNLRLLQFPFFVNSFFNKSLEFKKNFYDYEKRKANLKKKISKDSFVQFLYENIFFDIPKIFLENFKENEKRVNSYNLSPKIIYSGYAHHYNDLFKIWLAKKASIKKIPFNVICHGGDHTKQSGIFDFETRISSNNFRWVKSKKNQANLPAAKYINKSFYRDKNKKLLLFLSHELNPYPFRLDEAPITIDNLNLGSILATIKKKLNKKIFDQFFFCPKFFGCDKFQNDVRINLDKNKILKPFQFEKNLRKAKIVFCTYPQTAFIDAIRNGPTILFIDNNYWRPEKNLKKIYTKLKKERILFYSLDDAIKHINNIWYNIDEWWNSSNVKNAKKEFLIAMSCDDNNEKKWINYLSK